MKRLSNKMAAIGAVAAISATGLTGVQIASAATDTTTSTNPMSSLVDAVASKFNLNKSDVQAVFDEQRSQMEADREAEIKEQVAQLVSDGTLTQDQADKINAKRAELKSEHDANRTSDQDLTDEERKAKMDERKSALDAWLSENGIDSEYAYLLMGGRGHGPGGPGFGGSRHSSDSTTQTQ